MKEQFKELIDSLPLYNWKLIIGIFLVTVVLDQVTKQYFEATLLYGDHVPVIGDFFRLTLHKNPGIAFGITLFDSRIVFVLFTIAVIIFIFFYLISYKNLSTMWQTVIGLIMGGAVGNLIDRALFGKVIDFLDVEFFDIRIDPFSFLGYDFSGFYMYRWPIFNVADMAVSAGLILVLYSFFMESRSGKGNNAV